MLFKVADLITEIPEAGATAPRFQDYSYSGNDGADIIIRTDLYHWERYSADTDPGLIHSLESCRQFYMNLYRFNGMMLHASAVELDGKAYLFSGLSGMGKSTHTRIWQSVHGSKAQVFNDDKPALRLIDGKWYAYGTPWCGKDGIQQNKKVPVAGICFLQQSKENKIRRLTPGDAAQRIITQTVKRYLDISQVTALMTLVDNLVRTIPVFELENRPEPEAALLSYETMRRAAEELGL